ncbi:flagellar type III secretion system pore protein FliP [Poseidonocella sp. HB161398]|uniref:flagellar type III secretion system pore protein FliP n=1 Tax=Poseidonocella sp. HB161398 TaxID=2320855 RepID=UPI001486E22B|nr:flagellar type III secretion system pore protein FliP [Poseidonocella sp. HB161398]
MKERQCSEFELLKFLKRTLEVSSAVLFVWTLIYSGPAVSLGADSSFSDLNGRVLGGVLLVSGISIVPLFVVVCTCFPFLIVVFSICRQAIGLQQSPPNLLLVALSLALTLFIMGTEIQESWVFGVIPFLNGEADIGEFIQNFSRPYVDFMQGNSRGDVLQYFVDRSGLEEISSLNAVEKMSFLVPSFVLSELSRAFLVGFYISLPFLMIDLVTAAILMSMGMMMVPPAVVSMPFKLAFFVVANGWLFLSASMIEYYQ